MFVGDPSVEYRPIPSRPNYFAGDDGSIWSFFRDKPLKRKFVTLPNGRLYVSFSRGMAQVSRLILEAFVGPCPAGMECCHGPGGCDDNRPSNLRWGTHESNMVDVHRYGEMDRVKGEGNANAVLTNETVTRIAKMIREGIKNGEISKFLGVDHHAVSRVSRGLAWSHITGFPKRVELSRARK